MAVQRQYKGRIKAVRGQYKGRLKATAILPFCHKSFVHLVQPKLIHPKNDSGCPTGHSHHNKFVATVRLPDFRKKSSKSERY